MTLTVDESLLSECEEKARAATPTNKNVRSSYLAAAFASFSARMDPPTTLALVAAYRSALARIAELEAENAKLSDENYELKTAPWASWATECLQKVREYSGYDGFDDANGVDLPEELGECLEEMDRCAKEARRAALEEAASVCRRHAGSEMPVRTFQYFGDGLKDRLWKLVNVNRRERAIAHIRDAQAIDALKDKEHGQ